MYNSCVKVYPEGAPEQSTKIVVLGFRGPAGHNLKQLRSLLCSKLDLCQVTAAVELEEEEA